MSNQPYLYDPQANVLRQRANRRPLNDNDYYKIDGAGIKFFDHQSRIKDSMALAKYMDSLPAYTPVSGWVPEVGKEYVEGKDFQVQNKDENDRCPECGHEEYEDEGFLGKGFRVCAKCHQEWWLDVKYNSIYSKVAVPIEQKYITTDLTKTSVQYTGEVIEQKQEGAPKCTCQNERQYMSCTIWCERIIAEEEEGGKQEEPRAFSIQDMIECWEAGRKSGFWTPILSRTDKKQYFKSKGIDLP